MKMPDRDALAAHIADALRWHDWGNAEIDDHAFPLDVGLVGQVAADAALDWFTKIEGLAGA